MARRPRGSFKKQKFRLSGLRDVLINVTDMLYKAISKQNPDIDQDDVEDELRALVRKLGGITPGADAPAEATASANDDRPEYNLAGDILVIAHESYSNGDYRGAFKLFATAMDSPGASALFAGIKEMNAGSDINEVAASINSDEEEVDDAFSDMEDDPSEDEDDALDEVVAEFDEEFGDEESDDSEDEGDAFAADDVMEEVDAEFEDDEEEIDDSVGEDVPGVPMNGVASTKTQAQLRALANKLSLDGSRASRVKANQLLKNGK